MSDPTDIPIKLPLSPWVAAPRPVVVLDIQHYGLPASGLESRGAEADLDGDGKIEIWEKEAELTPMYGAAATEFLARSDVLTIFYPTGFQTYTQRANRIKALAGYFHPAEVVVVLCHLNAGGGEYGSVFYLDGQGKDCARAIATSLGELPELEKAVSRQAKPDDWTKRAWACLSGYAKTCPVNLTPVLVEPWFLDNKKHQVLAGGDVPQRVGQAIAFGITQWLSSR